MTQSHINGWMRGIGGGGGGGGGGEGGGGGRGERVGAFRMGAQLNIHRNSCVYKGAEMAVSTYASAEINRGLCR